LIARKGPSGFTFAEAARFAGVSPAAPYRHFRDRDELLANVSLRGFALFEAALTRAWNDGQPNAFAAFERMGRAYLEFARTEPAYYSAMFEAGVPLDVNHELREAVRARFRGDSRRRRTACHADSGCEASSSLDGRAACMGFSAWDCIALRAR